MNQEQEEQTGMFDTVVAYMDANEPIWSQNMAISATLADVKSGIALIDEKSGRQLSRINGIGEEKAQVRALLEKKVMALADPLSAIAAGNNDPILGAQVQLNASVLKKSTTDNLEEIAKRIATAGRENIEALARCQIGLVEIEGLEALILRFSALKRAPRLAIAGRAGNTATLAEVIKHTKGLLINRLDKLITPFLQTEPEFVAGYHSARHAVKQGARKSARVKEEPPTGQTETESELIEGGAI